MTGNHEVIVYRNLCLLQPHDLDKLKEAINHLESKGMSICFGGDDKYVVTKKESYGRKCVFKYACTPKPIEYIIKNHKRLDI